MPGASILIKQSGARALVTVSWMGSWRDSLFVLLHELGHVASIKITPDGIKICLRKRASSEKQANLTAYKVLTVAGFNKSILNSYVNLYNSLNKKPIEKGKRKPFIVT
jgi:Zn-dependent peptidase ImmA (M78 family)